MFSGCDISRQTKYQILLRKFQLNVLLISGCIAYSEVEQLLKKMLLNAIYTFSDEKLMTDEKNWCILLSNTLERISPV